MEEIKLQAITKAGLNEDEVIIKAVYQLIKESVVTKDKIGKKRFMKPNIFIFFLGIKTISSSQECAPTSEDNLG